MSVIKKKFLLLKSKQFISNRVLKLCRKYGINTRCPFVYIPSRITKLIHKKLKRLFNLIVLKRQIKKRIQHLQTIRTYKGTRHRKGLPVRGQRTHTNAKTRKKNKVSEFKSKENTYLSKKLQKSKK